MTVQNMFWLRKLKLSMMSSNKPRSEKICLIFAYVNNKCISAAQLPLFFSAMSVVSNFDISSLYLASCVAWFVLFLCQEFFTAQLK